MRPVKEETLDAMEAMALKCAKAISEYLTYQGGNPAFEKKARVAGTGISAFGRVRASETNREQVEHMAKRLNGEANQIAVVEPKKKRQITDGKAK